MFLFLNKEGEKGLHAGDETVVAYKEPGKLSVQVPTSKTS